MSVPPWASAFSLHEAIYMCSVEVIKAKLDLYGNSYDINSLDRTGRTPLQCAICRFSEPVVQLLIEKGAKLDAKDFRGDTALHYSICGDDKKALWLLEMLVNKGVDLNTTGQSKQTPLHVAIRRDFESCVEYLLEKGANVNVQDHAGGTPLHYAILRRKESIVRSLLEHELLPNLKDKNGQTALHLAAKINYLTGVALLLEIGSNINAEDNMGNTPLHYSVFPGKKKLADHKSFVNLLLSNNANLDQKNGDGQTPLHFAVIGNYLPEVDLFFKAGSEVDVRDISGRTPLHYANMRKHVKLKMLKTLLENGADVNSTDSTDRTPLLWAAMRSFVLRGALLIKYGAAVDSKDDSLNTPLHLCSSRNSTEFVKLLLDNGCEIDTKNINGYTPLQIAVEKDLKSVSKLLLNKGAEVNIKGECGRSPLHVAVSNMNVKIVEKLLQNGADVNCKDGNGQTALHIAAEYTFTSSTLPRCKAIINLLLMNGSDVIVKDKRGHIPMELAFMKFYNGFDIVQLLMEWGGLNTDSSVWMIDETLKGWSITSSTFINIVKDFIVKLKYARILFEAPYNIDITVDEDENMRTHCCEELERMKKTNFERHALSDIFFKYSDLTFLSNSSIKNNIFSTSLGLENEFPLYATILRATYLKGRERLDLLPVVSRVLMLPLPEEMLRKILSYVSDKDLKNVIKAGEEETAE